MTSKETWFRFYRSSLENKIWLHDPTAWRVFEYLMMICDYKTGEGSYGRNTASSICGIHPSTYYKAVQRLETAGMVTQSSNNHFTSFSIVNWGKYQQVGNTNQGTKSNNKVTHIKNIRNKDIDTKVSIVVKNLTDMLFEKIKENYPFVTRVPSDKDYAEMDKITRLDGYPLEVIHAAIIWSQQDDFWKQNIRSVGALRKKMETLVIKAKSQQGGKVVRI